MTLPSYKSYRYHRAQHWRAGVADQLELSNEGLTAPSLPSFAHMADVASESFLLAADAADDIYSLDTNAGLWRIVDGKQHRMTQLAINTSLITPDAMAVGFSNIWLQVTQLGGGYWGKRQRVLRYDKTSGAALPGLDCERVPLAIASDHGDGLWVVLGGDEEPASLNHYDEHGSRTTKILLPEPLSRASLVLNCPSADGSSLDDCSLNDKINQAVILDRAPVVDPCENPISWRLWHIDLCQVKVAPLYHQIAKDGVCHREYSDFVPTMLTFNSRNKLYLLDGESGELWTLVVPASVPNRDSSDYGKAVEIAGRFASAVAGHWLPASGLIFASKLVLAGPFVLAQSSETPEAVAIEAGAATGSAESGQTSNSDVSTYITPMMLSPDGAQQGWSRADLDVALAAGASVELTVAATDDIALVQEVATLVEDKRHTPSAIVSRLNKALPWREQQSKIYRSEDWQAYPLRLPLHEVEHSYLWLRIRLFPAKRLLATQAEAIQVKSLQVHYPNISYTRFLPALYQQDDLGSKTLRSFLVMFESVFGDLNRHISELPENIHPQTAPAQWLAFLLRWLGLPLATELDEEKQRALLISAPKLLQKRGTLEGLVALLKIVVEGEFHIRDSGAEPAPWVLPSNRPLQGARLGQSTLVSLLPQQGFILKQACLGQQKLGTTLPSGQEAFAKRSRSLDIRVATRPALRPALKDLLTRYLPYFVPAHCRYALHFVNLRDLNVRPSIDQNLRVRPTPQTRLGDNTTAGRLHLPTRSTREPGIVVNVSRLQTGLTL